MTRLLGVTLCTFALEEDKFELLPKQKDKY